VVECSNDRNATHQGRNRLQWLAQHPGASKDWRLYPGDTCGVWLGQTAERNATDRGTSADGGGTRRRTRAEASDFCSTCLPTALCSGRCTKSFEIDSELRRRSSGHPVVKRHGGVTATGFQRTFARPRNVESASLRSYRCIRNLSSISAIPKLV
jgi:hypothetical protein